MRPFRHDVVLGVVFAIASSVVAADDWSRFRGPNGDSIANQTKHPVEWSEDSNVAWKVKIPGRGWSQPIVTGDTVFVTTAVTENEEKPRRFDGVVPAGAKDPTNDIYQRRPVDPSRPATLVLHP